MSHLTDMEELLGMIPGSEIRDYMREAMNCYMAGAYRGSLVLSYIALFDDLLAKLGELGNVNSAAKTIHTEAAKKKGNQDVYESYLIDQLSSKNLITGLDASFLTTLRTLRNKSAHPSGHKPSAEEARFVFYETVSRFLARSILSTTHLVDQLIDRLKNTNFFPSSTVADLKAVVADETAALHDEALPQLVIKLVASASSSDAPTRTNASLFLIGLAKLDKPASTAALQAKFITPKADDGEFSDLITQAISANGKLVTGLTSTTTTRIRAVLAKKIAESTPSVSESKSVHPTSALTSIAAAMPEPDFAATFGPELAALFDKRAHSAFVVQLVRDKPYLQTIYFPRLLARAGSSTFDRANSVSNALDSLDQPLATFLSDEQAFQLIVAILRAADWGAWSAKGVSDSKFSDAPHLRAKAKAHIAANKVAAESYIQEKLTGSTTAEAFVSAHLEDEESA